LLDVASWNTELAMLYKNRIAGLLSASYSEREKSQAAKLEVVHEHDAA
jgi:hypothetical protein